MAEAWITNDEDIEALKAAAKAYVEAVTAVAARQYGDELAGWPAPEKAVMLIHQGMLALTNHFANVDLRERVRGIGICYGGALAQYDVGSQIEINDAFERGVVAGATMLWKATADA